MTRMHVGLALTLACSSACEAAGKQGNQVAADTFMVFSRGYEFAPELRSVLQVARQLADSTRSQITAAHLIIAVLSSPGNSGLAALKTLPINLAHLDSSLRALPPLPAAHAGPYSRDAQRALETAMEEARSMQRPQLTAADVLIGAISRAGERAQEILKAQHVSSDAVRAATRRGVGGA
jgi:ATP-dependent Clp protease ATP-binding subunit ClpA